MAETDIFISYSREDRQYARNLASVLEREGFVVWWDAALHSGESFDMVIEEQLTVAKAVVVLWSPRSVKSRWVRAEATMADKHGKLAPLIIEPCNRPIIFELMHTVDLSHWDGSTDDPVWLEFLLDLRRLTKVTEKSPAAATSQAALTEPSPPAFLRLAVEADKGDDETYDATQFYTINASPALPRHRLQLMVDGSVAQSYDVGPLGLRIGRSEPAEIVLADKRVSRRHCTIELHGDGLVVRDLGSTNGTFVDGERIADCVAFPQGSVLRVGGFDFVHEVVAPANA